MAPTSEAIFRGSAAFREESHGTSCKVFPYIETCRWESLVKTGGDTLACLKDVCPHAFSPLSKPQFQVDEQAAANVELSAESHKPWSEIITHITRSSSVPHFSLLLVFTGRVKSYTFKNDVQPTSHTRLARKNKYPVASWGFISLDVLILFQSLGPIPSFLSNPMQPSSASAPLNASTHMYECLGESLSSVYIRFFFML